VRIQLILLFSFLHCVNPLESQHIKWLTWRAQTKINAGAYQDAAMLYRKALTVDSTHYTVNIELGKLFLYEFELFDSSEFYLARGIRNRLDEKDSSDYYAYARVLQLNEHPSVAIKYYRLYAAYVSNQKNSALLLQLTNEQIKACENAVIGIEASNKITTVKNMGFETNSPEREYTTVIARDQNMIIYNGRYQDSNKEKLAGDSKFMENVYYFEIDENTVSTYDQSIEQENHWAVVSAVPNTDSVLIYYKNALHYSSLKEQKLSNYLKLPDGITNYYFQPHGSFSAQRDTFIFSAKKTAEDDLDLFITYLNNGKWSLPTLLDSLINTSFDEDSPFISTNGKTLYFSSKTSTGYGGYDVYKSTLVDGVWSTPVNMGYPINSAGDDIYFVLETNDKYGYISSNRTGGFGQMDLYSVALVPRPTFDCAPYPNEEFLVTFDLSESVDSNSVELAYNWYFEDGETFEGEIVQKSFKYPGDYIVKIDILENLSGLIEKSEIIKEFTIEEVNFVGFNSQRITDTSYFVSLNAGISWLEDLTLITYNWKINDSIISLESPTLTYDFKESGDFIVHLQIDALDEDDNLLSFCSQDKVSLKEKITSEELETIRDSFLLAGNSVNLENDLIDEVNNTSSENSNENTSKQTEDPIKDETLSKEEATAILKDLDNGRTAVSFGNIYFGFDQYTLTAEAEATLDSIVAYLFEDKDATMMIYGHTDSKGSDEYNFILSKKRANTAVAYLLSKGIAANRIVKTEYLGENEPDAPNEINGRDNPKGRQLNRRVTLVLIN